MHLRTCSRNSIWFYHILCISKTWIGETDWLDIRFQRDLFYIQSSSWKTFLNYMVNPKQCDFKVKRSVLISTEPLEPCQHRLIW